MSAAENLLLDTNVLVYLFDLSEPVKAAQAKTVLFQILAAGKPILSTQILSEFYWTITRKIPVPLDHDQALAEVIRLEALTHVVPMTWQTLERAFQVIGRYQIPLWDAQVVAAGALNGAAFILSEDFQHRQVLEGITVLNPFATDFDLSEVLSP